MHSACCYGHFTVANIAILASYMCVHVWACVYKTTALWVYTYMNLVSGYSYIFSNIMKAAIQNEYETTSYN